MAEGLTARCGKSAFRRSAMKSSVMKPAMIETIPRREVIAIHEYSAVGDVAVVVEKDRVMVPIPSPMTPAPTEPPKQTNPEADAEQKSWSVKIQPGIPIPTRPCHDRASIDEQLILFRYINDPGVGRFDRNRLALFGYLLLGRSLQVPGVLCALAH